MAIVLSESFALISNAAELALRKWAFATNGVIAVGQGPHGKNCWNLQQANHALTVGLQNYNVEGYIGISFWRRYDVAPAAANWICQVSQNIPSSGVVSSSSTHSGLAGTGGNDLKVTKGNNGVVTTLSNVLILNQWQHFEWRLLIAQSTAGTQELWIDGVPMPDATLSGIDTADSGAAISICFNGVNSSNSMIADIIISQHASQPVERTGVARIHTLLPDGDGANTAWTGGFANVDDPLGASDGGTTQVTSSTLNAKQDYTFADLPETPSSILGVTVETEVSKDVVGAMGVTPYITSGVTEGTGGEVTVSTAFVTDSTIFDLDPDGSVAWTPAKVNALVAGHEITTL